MIDPLMTNGSNVSVATVALGKCFTMISRFVSLERPMRYFVTVGAV